MKRSCVLILFLMIMILNGCHKEEKVPEVTGDKDQKIQIGLSFDSFVIERWQRDRDVFVSTAQSLDAEVNVQNANGDLEEQISQIEYLIEKKVDVIVIVSADADALGDVLIRAKEEGIIVIAYDRLVRNADVDLYISFDNEEVGRLMAEAMVENLPYGGNLVTIFGPTSDNNVLLAQKGFNSVMENSGINVVYSVYAKDWLAEEAFDAVNEALIENSEINAVMCGNDNLASEAVRALSENRLAGKVIVTGQDADLAACQRIVEGTQTMTVYKPVDQLAKKAATYAVDMAKGKDANVQDTINDGTYNVPYIKLEPIAVTAENLYQVIIEGGFQLENEVYLNVERDE